MEELEPQKSGISRRTVTKAMAWAVPAIAIAAPAPAFAVSGEPPTVLIGNPCKLPGNSASGCSDVFAGCPGLDPDKAYAFPIRIYPGDDQTIYVTNVVINVTSSSEALAFGIACSPDYCQPITPGPGGYIDLLVYANSTNSNSNITATLTATVTWGHSVDTTGGTCTLTDHDHAPVVTAPVTVNKFLPCSSKSPFPQGSPTCDPPFYQ
ncbi:MAG: hypothetical protein ACTHNQ_09095 [Microbacterium sp.]|uniref:hypothetical protein n=1 Tax=Microbacterium sp. TaxID=51671 RepID=UPI003F80480E